MEHTSHNPFIFNKEHRAFTEVVSRYTQKELADGYLHRATQDEFFWDVYHELGRHGLLGITVSQEYGGQDADAVASGIACETVSRSDFNVAFVLFNSIAVGGLINQAGSQQLREQWLPHVVEGRKLVAFGLTEPESGSDAAALRMTARRVSHGWVLNGEKTSVSLGMHAHSVVIFARSDSHHNGVTAFVVPTDVEGVQRSPIHDAGFRPTGRASVAFNEVFVPDDCVLGEVGQGFRLVMRTFDYSRVLLGLMAIGTADAALTMAVEYAKQRHAFGTPIARFQGVSFTIAEHATLLEAAKWLSYRALALRDANVPHTKEASMVKWWAPRIAVQAIHDSIILHGHVGYSEDLPLQQMQRDVAGLEIGDGTPQIQKMIVAREIFGREFLPYGAKR